MSIQIVSNGQGLVQPPEDAANSFAQASTVFSPPSGYHGPVSDQPLRVSEAPRSDQSYGRYNDMNSPSIAYDGPVMSAADRYRIGLLWRSRDSITLRAGKGVLLTNDQNFVDQIVKIIDGVFLQQNGASQKADQFLNQHKSLFNKSPHKG